MQRIAQALARDIPALNFPNLTRLFLTHLHPDHVAGLPDLIIAPWVKGRSGALQIYGPAGTQAMVDHLLEAYKIGINEHRHGLAAIDHDLLVSVAEVQPGLIFQDDVVSVEAFRVDHGGLEAYGLKFTTLDKTIVFSGDTAYSETLVQAATGCDILVHEVCSARSLERHMSPEWQKYHRTVHTLAHELAEIANRARPRLLVLTHQLLWGDTSEDDLLQEITDLYDGPVVYGRDLDVIE